jgi:ATP-dependent Clp protease adaptor protein ClpS
MPQERQTPREDVLDRPAPEVKDPEYWRVLLHNDDYTPMGFVVEMLETVFLKPPAEAYRIMMQVHVQGMGLCGVYTFEIAETKVDQVHRRAREQGYPLRASAEPDTVSA